MRQLTYTIAEPVSSKSNREETPKIKIIDCKKISEAKEFLVDTIEDFNKYELTLKECLQKLDQYTAKIIEISTKKPFNRG